jgi:glycerol-3-phosphate dehydrogenase
MGTPPNSGLDFRKGWIPRRPCTRLSPVITSRPRISAGEGTSGRPEPRAARLAWDRTLHLKALGERVFDLVVVGGGATGCSVARDAALRGLDVCLIERGDIGSGTSSRSTRLIHGGLRYLKTLEFGFVREGLHERSILMSVAPHLVRPVEFLYPAFRRNGPPRWMLRLGVGLYDFLAGRKRLPGSRMLGAEEAIGMEPALRTEGLTGAVLYTDAGTDDARLVVETAVAAVEAGATVALHVEVERIVPSENGPAVLILKDRLGEEAPLGVRGAVVINAAGAWVGKVLDQSDRRDRPSGATLLRPSRGSHLVVSRETLPVSRVVVMTSRRDSRTLFAVPAGDFTYLGTTEVDHTGSLDEVRAEADEVDYILSVAGETFQNGRISRDRVLSTWAGIRPLLDRPRQASGDLSRDFRILQEAPGVVTVAGGKLTSCRRMAERAVDLAVSILSLRFGRKADACITGWKLFPGAEGPAPGGDDEAPPGLDAAVTKHLTTTYGSRAQRILQRIRDNPAAGAPFLSGCLATPAEVIHAVESEGAVRLADLLFRRLHPHFMEARLARENGRTVLEGAARVMASWLGWSEAQRAREVVAALAEWKRDFSVPAEAARAEESVPITPPGR